MPCYHPVQAGKSRALINGKHKIVYGLKESSNPAFISMKLPCRQCIGCRLEHSRQWAMRSVHEASLYERNCFITLTFDNDHLPALGSLDHSIWQRFMYRFRQKAGNGIRFFMCGEYGEVCKSCGKSKVYCKCVKFYSTLGRPHFHACIYNFDVPDRVLINVRDGINLYSSEFLSSVWTDGFSSVGDVTFESSAYVARYMCKKMNGVKGKTHYSRVDKSTGLRYDLKPEYARMSNRAGIGSSWFNQYKSDVYPVDNVVLRDGVKMRPPKYYDTLYERENPVGLLKIKEKRILSADLFHVDQTPDRLEVRERCHLLKMDMLKRNLEL